MRSVLLDCTGCVLLFPIASLKTSGCVLGFLPLCSSSQGVLTLGKHLEGDEMWEHGGGDQGKEGEVVEFHIEAACVPCLQQDVQLYAFPGCFCVSGSGREAQVWLKL